MVIRTEDFKAAATTILFAADLDKTAANLELVVQDNYLCLSVTNREYYVRQRFLLENPEPFRAVVDASLFLNLISGINTETITLTADDRSVLVQADRSKYKLALIYENDKLMELPVISLTNKTVEMSISNEVLKSILTFNSKELLKVKNIDVDELQKLYYITEEGCFTFTTGACLNSFTLEKPVKMLLNDRIVKLFKLFREDVNFSMGYDGLADGSIQTKVVFETPTCYVAALITCNDFLLSKIEGPCAATRDFINDKYAAKVVLPADQLRSAINRLMAFIKNSKSVANMLWVPCTVVVDNKEITIADHHGNIEYVAVENGSWVDGTYTMALNIADLKLIMDSCREQHVTLNCGNHRSVIVNYASVHNLIPESIEAAQ